MRFHYAVWGVANLDTLEPSERLLIKRLRMLWGPGLVCVNGTCWRPKRFPDELRSSPLLSPGISPADKELLEKIPDPKELGHLYGT